ncbi:MAG: NADH-quinone oxidoreductase subunit A [Planctomycetota bacterium]|nr:NADH-quinone oxidoreductase subunit A [Planctomycetota bacterium]
MSPVLAVEHELMQYSTAFMLLASAFLLTLALLTLSRLIRPHHPTIEKQMTYECGEDPVGSGWLRFNIRFYVVALVFVLFDVELALVFPIATLFKSLTASGGAAGVVVFGELFFFIGVLFLGLVYIWKKGDLGWVRTFRVPAERGIRSWEQPKAPGLTPSSAKRLS